MCKVEYGTSLSSSCTCSGTIIIGISESPATNLFQLVPNPTDRKIAIQIFPKEQLVHFTLFDTDGKQVLKRVFYRQPDY